MDFLLKWNTCRRLLLVKEFIFIFARNLVGRGTGAHMWGSPDSDEVYAVLGWAAAVQYYVSEVSFLIFSLSIRYVWDTNDVHDPF